MLNSNRTGPTVTNLLDHIEFSPQDNTTKDFKEITKLSKVVIQISEKTTTGGNTHSLVQHTILDVKEEKPQATNPILTYDST